MPLGGVGGVCARGFRYAIEIQHHYSVFHISQSGGISNSALDAACQSSKSCGGVAIAERVVGIKCRRAEFYRTRLGHTGNIVRSKYVAGDSRLSRVEKRRRGVGFARCSSCRAWLGYIDCAGIVTVTDCCCCSVCGTVLSSCAGKDGGCFVGPVGTKSGGQNGIDITQWRNRALWGVAEDIHRAAKAEVDHFVGADSSGGVLQEQENIVGSVCVILSGDGWICYRKRCRKKRGASELG